MKIHKLPVYLIMVFFLTIAISGCGSGGHPDKSESVTVEPDNTALKIAEIKKEEPAPPRVKTEDKAPGVKTTAALPSEAPESAVQPRKTEELKVTFIELGSVGCVPCRMMQPIMDDVEREYPGQVKVVFYDVWTPEGRPYAGKYGIRAIPTQVFLDKDGKEYFRRTGYFPKEELVKILKMQGVE